MRTIADLLDPRRALTDEWHPTRRPDPDAQAVLDAGHPDPADRDVLAWLDAVLANHLTRYLYRLEHEADARWWAYEPHACAWPIDDDDRLVLTVEHPNAPELATHPRLMAGPPWTLPLVHLAVDDGGGLRLPPAEGSDDLAASLALLALVGPGGHRCAAGDAAAMIAAPGLREGLLVDLAPDFELPLRAVLRATLEALGASCPSIEVAA